MKLTWTSPGGDSIEFSKDGNTYKLLKDYDGFSTADIAFMTTVAPFQDGVTRLDTRFNPRKISFSVMVTAPSLTDIQQAVLTLVRVFNPMGGPGVVAFEYEDGTVFHLNCSGTISPSPMIRGTMHQLVRVSLVAHDPFWYTDSKADSLGASTAATFPITFPITLAGNLAIKTLINYGDIDAAATIVITGDVSNPKVTNVTTGEYFSFTLDMDANDVLTVTTGFGNKTITYFDYSASTTVNGFQYLDASSVFWLLKPGENVISFTYLTADPAVTATVTRSDRYSGV